MVANASNYSDTPFANGQLLDDLIQYVYNGRNCRMMFIGDSAQLPPVGETESPALQTEVMRSYGLHVHECNLNEVLRQSQESGILWNATEVRSLMDDGTCQLPKVRFEGFSDIHVVPGDELIEQLATSYSRAGMDETMVITRSNKRANIYNQGIRNMVLGREDELCSGDLLMIVKNNYYWTHGEEETAPAFLANGDRAVVRRVRRVEELYGFRFAEVTMTFPDYDDYELTATVLLDTLTSEAPALTRDQQTELYNQVMADYAYITRDRRHVVCRLYPLALHSLHTSHRAIVSRELAHESKEINYFRCLRIHSICPLSVASLVQCSLTGVSRLSFGPVSTFHTAYDVVGGQVLSL